MASATTESLVDEVLVALGTLVDPEDAPDAPIPSEMDSCAMRLATSFLALPTEVQSEVRGLVDGRLWQLLIAVSARLATLAVRDNDPAPLRAALALHAIEDFRFDERENVRVLALLHDARRRLGVSKEQVWGGDRETFSEQGRATLDYYPEARPESMGCTGTYVNGLFCYVATRTPDPD